MNQELLQQCRWYNGNNTFLEKLMEKEELAFLFWEAEELYVQMEDVSEQKKAISFYLDSGLAGYHMEIPILLCACIFEMFNKGTDRSPLDNAIFFQKRDILSKYLAGPQ